jgi:hypothetical protein
MLNWVPWPKVLATSTTLPWLFTMPKTVDRPSPVPTSIGFGIVVGVFQKQDAKGHIIIQRFSGSAVQGSCGS